MREIAVEDRLRSLAAAARPAVVVQPGLAARVIRQRNRRSGWRKLLASVGVVATATTAVAVTVAARGSGPYRSIDEPSASMAPTVLTNEHVIMDRHLRPGRLDVVTLRLTPPGGAPVTAIKRVLAFAGETIACPEGPGGVCAHVLLNGRILDEPYLHGHSQPPFVAVTVPPGMLFIAGDNRENSADSRNYWGPVPASEVTGVVVRITDTRGRERTVPGAPAHRAPPNGGGPEEGPPPAQAPSPQH